MSKQNGRVGFTIGDGFRLGLGFALASALVSLLAFLFWTIVLAGMFALPTLR